MLERLALELLGRRVANGGEGRFERVRAQRLAAAAARRLSSASITPSCRRTFDHVWR
jgi:hypothetical protein